MAVKIRILLLYALLVVGAVIHIRGIYPAMMLQITGWMLIALSVWLVAEFAWYLKSEPGKRTANPNNRSRFLIWSLCVVAFALCLEWLGVHTGVIFGGYQYHAALKPQIANVPLAIGFSWLTLLLSTTALERRLSFRLHLNDRILRSLVIAILLLIFDLVVEPSAVKLGYWRWQGGNVPWGNYLSWFGIGWVLAYVSIRLEMWRRGFPQIAYHFYLAQLIYFALVYLA